MKQPPYSFSEAVKLSEKFQHIVGLAYDQECHSEVDKVVVTPYDTNSKNRFMMIYLMLNDAAQALSLDYNGTQYDVVVISATSQSIGMQHKSLSAWLAANKELEISFTGVDSLNASSL